MGVWETKKGELASASSHDFERRSLPLLRVTWPSLIRPRETLHLDRQGIDLLVWSDDLNFPCVVQCKGLYKEEQLVESQLSQIHRSIEAFIRSPYTCDHYVLLHNRTGEEKETHSKIRAKLDELIKIGKAKAVTLWDRQTFIRDTKARLGDLLAAEVVAEAVRLLDQQRRFFVFGDVFVSNVPVTSRKWILRSGYSTSLESEGPPEEIDVSKLIISPSRSRWTLLIGPFGVGKTTTALRAASCSSNRVIYVRCQDFPDEQGSFGTNYLMQEIVRSLNPFADWEDETRRELENLSGPVLAAILRNPNSEFSLIIDGIDESHTYGAVKGITKLTNEIAELKCPIILTTRKEHFDSTFGNYESVAKQLMREEITSKGGGKRNATVIELKGWSEKQIIQLVQEAIALCEPQSDAQNNLLVLEQRFLDGTAFSLYEELLGHPLFLQMMLDLAFYGKLEIFNRCKLIDYWVSVKIERDLGVPRLMPVQVVDKNSFVTRMMRLMEDVAFAATARDETGYYLMESIESSSIVQLATASFQEPIIDISTITNTSVLVPASRRLSHDIPVRFYHRIFHEFFLARYLHRTISTPLQYPASVADFFNELELLEAE